MPEVFSPYEGLWRKFTRYELRDGYICPAPEAQLESYDPWKGYLDAREAGKERVPPYQTLLELTKDLRAELFRELDLRSSRFIETNKELGEAIGEDRELKEDILRWCSRHGLLGLLPQLFPRIRLPVVVLGASWDQEDSMVAKMLFSMGRYMQTPDGWIDVPLRMVPADGEANELLTHLRTERLVHKVARFKEADGWAPDGANLFTGTVPLERLRPIADKLTLENDSPASYYGTELWLLGPRNLRVGDFVPLDELEDVFFPQSATSAPRPLLMPRPFTEDFWRLYAEPVGLFLAWAVWLKLAIESLRGGEAPAWRLVGWERAEPSLGRQVLDWITWSASPVLGVSGQGRYEQRWKFPSLIGSLAMMMYVDLVVGGRVKVCGNCATVFVSRAGGARYCSHRCQNTAQKRRQRARTKRRRAENSG